MKFYEIRMLAPEDMDSGELEARARGAAADIDANVEVLSATIHARPAEGTGRFDGAIFVVVLDDDEDALYKFSGAFARVHGQLAFNFAELVDETLSLKGHRETVADFIEAEFGIDVNIERDENDEEYVDRADEDDDDTFSINMPEDAHDF